MTKNSKIIEFPIIVETSKEQKNIQNIIIPFKEKIEIQDEILSHAIKKAQNAIAEKLVSKDEKNIPNPNNWLLKENQRIMWIAIDLQSWLNRNHVKTIHRSVTIPEYLNSWAKENKINVSRLITQQLKLLYEKD